MSRILIAGSSLAVILAVTALPAAAEVETYTIDQSHSMVGFKIRHFVSKVPGRFDDYSGTLTVDRENLAVTKIEVEINAASIDTDNDDRDAHLRSPDFFDVENSPTITFKSTKVTPKGKEKATVEGTLTMRGVTKPVTMEVDILGYSPDAWGGFRAGYEATVTIDRKEFGIVWNKVLDTGGFILGDSVEITLLIEAIRQEAKPAK
jgi:polyisoprenoid-binding protein YceI